MLTNIAYGAADHEEVLHDRREGSVRCENEAREDDPGQQPSSSVRDLAIGTERQAPSAVYSSFNSYMHCRVVLPSPFARAKRA